MVATTTYPAIYSLFQILSTPFSAYFRPKNYIFTYFKKESSSGSAQKLLGLEDTNQTCGIHQGWKKDKENKSKGKVILSNREELAGC